MGNFVTDLRVRWPAIHPVWLNDFEANAKTEASDRKDVRMRVKPGEWASDNILNGYGEFIEELANEIDPCTVIVTNT